MTSPALISYSGPAELAQLDARLPSTRFWEFFVANIRNRNTVGPITRRRVDSRIGAKGGIFDLTKISPIVVAAFIEQLQVTHSKPTVKEPSGGAALAGGWARRVSLG